MIEIKDKSGKLIDSLVQWDLNQTIYIHGSNLTSAPLVHFANGETERAYTVTSTLESGAIKVTIPNAILRSNRRIYVYVYTYDSNTLVGNTVEIAHIDVKAKTRPDDYIFNEDYPGINMTILNQQVRNLMTREAQITKDINELKAQSTSTIGNLANVTGRVGSAEIAINNLKESVNIINGKDTGSIAKAVSDALASAKSYADNVVYDWAKASTKPSYSKTEVGLSNVTNDKQMKGLASGTTQNHVVVFGADGYTVKDGGYTIESSVPKNAVFTDTTYKVFDGAQYSQDGTAGLVPAPSTGTPNRVLTSGGTFVQDKLSLEVTPNDESLRISVSSLISGTANADVASATKTKCGLMSASDKQKLDNLGDTYATKEELSKQGTSVLLAVVDASEDWQSVSLTEDLSNYRYISLVSKSNSSNSICGCTTVPTSLFLLCNSTDDTLQALTEKAAYYADDLCVELYVGDDTRKAELYGII